MVEHRDFVMKCFRIVLIEAEALFKGGLIVKMQRQS
jgi:hypothetical protein